MLRVPALPVARHLSALSPSASSPSSARPTPPAPSPRTVTTMGLVAWGTELLRTCGALPPDDRAPRPETCVFCAKIGAHAERCARAPPRDLNPSARRGDPAFRAMDDELVVFEDWKPAARRHYLVCPRAHVLSARSLGAADAAMARRMLEAGRAALEADFPDERDRPAFRFGFHLPPFNSVDHLHMHAFALPFEPEWKERKYSVESWARFAFEPAEENVARVEKLAAEEGGAAAPGERREAAPAGRATKDDARKTTKASPDRDPDADPARRKGTSEAAEGAVVEGGGGEGGGGEGGVSGSSSSSRL